MEAVLPVHPDEQKAILKDYTEKEYLKPVRPEDWERIFYYIFEVIVLYFNYILMLCLCYVVVIVMLCTYLCRCHIHFMMKLEM